MFDALSNSSKHLLFYHTPTAERWLFPHFFFQELLKVHCSQEDYLMHASPKFLNRIESDVLKIWLRMLSLIFWMLSFSLFLDKKIIHLPEQSNFAQSISLSYVASQTQGTKEIVTLTDFQFALHALEYWK